MVWNDPKYLCQEAKIVRDATACTTRARVPHLSIRGAIKAHEDNLFPLQDQVHRHISEILEFCTDGLANQAPAFGSCSKAGAREESR